MATIGPIAVVGSAAAAVAGVATVALLTRAQPANQSPKPAHTAMAKANAAGSAIAACAGSDRILRIESTGHCEPSEMPVPLDTGGQVTSRCDDCDRPPFPPESPSDRPDPLGKLEARLDALNRWPLFEVVTERGRTVFSVAPGRAYVYNAAEKAVAAMRATDHGGYVWVNNSGGEDLRATFGFGGETGGLLIAQGGLTRVDFGRKTPGNYSLVFPSAAGPRAGIGETRSGGGRVLVGDREGRLRVDMSGAGGNGTLAVFNKTDAVARLGPGEQGGGLFQIGNLKGDPFVKMGVKDDRYGIVLAGPRAGFPYVPASGLPGSFFLGCAGGERCTGW